MGCFLLAMSGKILITGSDGMLATDLAGASAEAGYQVVGLSHRQLDITDPNQVRQAFDQIQPDIVVNTPGIGVDACQVRPEDGYRLHSWAAGLLSRECNRIGSAIVYISTCGLFGDERKFYSEYDPVQLKTQYARSKYLGERATLDTCQRAFVVRPGWLFGGTLAHQRNFVYQRYLEAKREPVMRSADDKFGSPTFTKHLANKVLEIVQSEQYGLYHVTNAGGASRYEYVKRIIEAFGLSSVVVPVQSSAFPRDAPVPDCEQLENLNLRFMGLEPLGPWEEAVEAYVSILRSCGN